MGLLEIIILAVVQGITEFLPISSSGHLRAAAEILGIPGSTLVIDVAVHVGSLGAVIVYFWRDIARIAVGVVQFGAGSRTDGGGGRSVPPGDLPVRRPIARPRSQLPGQRAHEPAGCQNGRSR